jgi:hypothetical protein
MFLDFLDFRGVFERKDVRSALVAMQYRMRSALVRSNADNCPRRKAEAMNDWAG